MIEWVKGLVRDEVKRILQRPTPAHVGVVVELAQVREELRCMRTQVDVQLEMIVGMQTELHDLEERLMLQELETRRILNPEVKA